MASFVEQATLKVNDQSTAQIKKINAALKELNKTARSLKNVNVNININTGDINKAVDAVKRLKTELKGLKSVKPNITAKSTGVRRSATAVRSDHRQMRDLRSTAGAIKMNVKMDSLKKAYGRLRTFQNAAKNAINVHATVPPQGASQGAPRPPRAPRAAAPISPLITTLTFRRWRSRSSDGDRRGNCACDQGGRQGDRCHHWL